LFSGHLEDRLDDLFLPLPMKPHVLTTTTSASMASVVSSKSPPSPFERELDHDPGGRRGS
jgi:hypothetical protein